MDNLCDNYAFCQQYPNLGAFISHLLPIIFAIAGFGVVFYFLIGAFRIITSGGNKETVASARAMITHAIIGFVMLMLVFTISLFVTEFFHFTGFNPFGTTSQP